MDAAVSALSILAGVAAIIGTIASAVAAVIVPRGIPSRLGRTVFRGTRRVFALVIGRDAPYARADRLMAMYGPASLLVLLAAWLTIVLAGYAAIYWGTGVRPIREAFVLSGSSLLTLGFSRPDTVPTTAISFSEAAVGLVLLALLITYLPSIYSAVSKREATVGLLHVRAGTPPSGVVMLERYHAIGALDDMDDLWFQLERWFIELAETHTSFPALTYFRSPQPDQSWITAAGAVLDGASLLVSTVEGGEGAEPQLCIRAGFLTLRTIASFFGIEVDHDPNPDDPISVSREEFDDAYERLARAGLRVKEDRDRAWRDFAGWRVNYDTALIGLAALVVAPQAPWSSDRDPPAQTGALRRLVARARPARS